MTPGRKMVQLTATLWEPVALRIERPREEAKREVVHAPARGMTVQERYDAVVVMMKKRYRVRVNKWRTTTTGAAWEVTYSDGSLARLIEAPYPRGPVSLAVFLHEIGHHAIGFHRYRPRCYEEYKAWEFALVMMREYGFKVSGQVVRRMDMSLRYAVEKARRRGIKAIPAELRRWAR